MRRTLAALLLAAIVGGGGFVGGIVWERARPACHTVGGQEDSPLTDCDFRDGAIRRGAPNREAR